MEYSSFAVFLFAIYHIFPGVAIIYNAQCRCNKTFLPRHFDGAQRNPCVYM